MKSYVIRNGKLQTRQKDYNIPTYRILPYNQTINPKPSDYLQVTIKQTIQKYQNLQKQYYKLNKVFWKIVQSQDNATYDNTISFLGISQNEILRKVSLLRNAYIQKQELNLSQIKNQSYNVIEQALEQQEKQNSQIYQQILIGRQSQSSHLDSRMKHRLSLALNQQQQLRNILQQEVQKLNKQLIIKNQQLFCVIGDIQMKNSLISKLKECRSQKQEFIKMSRNKSSYSAYQQSHVLQQSNSSIKSNKINIQKSANCDKIRNLDEQIQNIIDQLILVSEQQFCQQGYQEEEQSQVKISHFFLVSPRQDKANISKEQIQDGLKNVPMIKSIQVNTISSSQTDKQNLVK